MPYIFYSVRWVFTIYSIFWGKSIQQPLAFQIESNNKDPGEELVGHQNMDMAAGSFC
jgi:hypothetical protein